MRRDQGCTATTRRCEFWTWSEDYVRPACCTQLLMNLALSVHHTLEKRNIPHWLDYGSLLGAVRDGRLIAWDRDVDFGYFHEDHDRVVEALRTVDGYWDPKRCVDNYLYATVSSVNLIDVDLFPWSRDGDVVTTRWPYEDLWPGQREPKSFPVRFLEQLEPVTLEGETFPAPSPVREFLEDYRYGPTYLAPTRGPTTRLKGPFGPDESVDAVGDLWERLASRQRRLRVLLAKPGVHHDSLRGRWNRTLHPIRPRADYVERALELVPAGERGAMARQLADALALVEQNIDELEHPSVSTLVRRRMRRARRIVRRITNARRRR